jgi:uncharacterized protein (DUF2141 family)
LLRFVLAAAMAAALALPDAALAASLTVNVERVSPRGGNIRLALYTEATWPNDDADPVADLVVPAVNPETIATFTNLKPGVYGLKCFQDVNRNGQFDTDWLGLPLEKFCFSRDAHPIFSEPGFGRAKFTLSDGANTIIVHLQ